MSIIPATSPVTSPALTPSKLIVALVAFTDHRDLVLGTPGLNAGSHVTTHVAETIWVHEQPFTSWQEAWKWVYQIQNLETQKACANNLVGQKIRSLNALAKSSEEILDMFKKDFVYLGLDKKKSKELRAGLDGYIKVVSVALAFLILPGLAYQLLNLNRVNGTKANKQTVSFG